MCHSLPTVLVTGATGFVGTTLCRQLLSDGVLVRGTVRDGAAVGVLPSGVIQVPVSTGPETDWTVALQGVDVVVHLAARVHVMQDVAKDPLALYREVNVAGTERLARMASASGVRRFIFISTVKVYGEETLSPYSEKSPHAPLDAYGMSKAEAETALWRIAGETGLEVVIVRPPLVYGPGVKANFLRMLEVVKRGVPLPFASINNRRSLVYVGNLADAIATCAVHPAAAGESYVVSDGEDVSTPELLRLTAVALGCPARVFPCPPALLNLAGKLTGKSPSVARLVGSLAVDSSKIRAQLGWKPPFTLEQGLAQTVKWFNSRRQVVSNTVMQDIAL